MPNKVEITEPALNIVEVSIAPTTVEITEQTNTVFVESLSRAIGNATIASGIDITNTIGDAIAGGTYASGTTLEAIVRDLISPFLEPAFSSVSWSATGTHQAGGEDLLVECGLSASVSSLSITWTNPENLDDDTNLLIEDINAYPTATLANANIEDYGALSVPHVQAASYAIPIMTSPFDRKVRISTAYLGDNGAGAAVALTKTVNIYHRHRVYVVSTGQSTLVGATAIQYLLNNLSISGGTTLISTLAVDPTLASQNLSVQCNSGSADSQQFTWILIPGSGTLGEVAAEVNGRGVADYTDSFIEYNNSGSGYSHTVGSATPTYKAYRSIQPGAFDSDVTLNIEITH